MSARSTRESDRCHHSLREAFFFEGGVKKLTLFKASLSGSNQINVKSVGKTASGFTFYQDVLDNDNLLRKFKKKLVFKYYIIYETRKDFYIT